MPTPAIIPTPKRPTSSTSQIYSSPLGPIFLSADELGLTSLYFGTPTKLPKPITELVIPGTNLETIQNTKDTPKTLLELAQKWLDLYFSGQIPTFTPALHFLGSPFQLQIWQLLLQIPYNQTTAYGELASKISPRMSAQAVGGAVGRNPISLIAPCHRVVGAKGQLTGYAAGLDKKTFLLNLERQNHDNFNPQNRNFSHQDLIP